MVAARRIAPLCFVLSLLAGCFVYSPAETRNTPAGKMIEVTLSQQGARLLEPDVGSLAYIVSGVLLGDDRQAIEMRFFKVHRTDGQALRGNGQRIRVPHEHVLAIHERRVSKPRTWAMSLTSIGVVLWTSRRH